MSDMAMAFAVARAGSRVALAQVLSVIERGGEDADEVSRLAVPGGQQGYCIGLTGAPGVGKSTLANSLITHIRSTGERVAVLAVDPTSPYTGGAILGDRIRMAEHASDEYVYIRSLASRGELGGLCMAAAAAVRVLRAVGFSWILIESVGVGQVQVAAEEASDTTIVVVGPDAGDGVQASKAGLLEIGDIFVVNKAENPEAERTRRDLKGILDLVPSRGWSPPVLCTEAATGVGTAAVWEAILEHRGHLIDSGRLRDRRVRQWQAEMEATLSERTRRMAAYLLDRDAVRPSSTEVLKLDPRAVADEILGRRPA